MNAENYMFRSIKLESEINKIKEKVYDDLSKKQLKTLIPYD